MNDIERALLTGPWIGSLWIASAVCGRTMHLRQICVSLTWDVQLHRHLLISERYLTLELLN